MRFQTSKPVFRTGGFFRLPVESGTGSFWRMGAHPGRTMRWAAALTILLAVSLTWGAGEAAAQGYYPGGYGPGMQANAYGGQYAPQYAPSPQAGYGQPQYAQPSYTPPSAYP